MLNRTNINVQCDHRGRGMTRRKEAIYQAAMLIRTCKAGIVD